MSDLDQDLKGCELLRDLGEDERGTLGELLEERDLVKGEPLFRAGDEAGELLLIAEGSVKLELRGVEFGKLSAGETLGSAGLISIGQRECDAVAAEPTRVLSLGREGYLRLRADFPMVALSLQEGVLRELASYVRLAVDSAAD